MIFRLAFLGLVFGALSACESGPEVSMGRSGLGFFSNVSEKIAVADRSVIIAGPPGYCVDKSATRDSKTGAFVLLGSCASIRNKPGAGAPSLPGILTASVSASANSGSAQALDRMQAFFESPEGKGALARDRNPASVSILKVQRARDAVFLNLKDVSSNSLDGISPEYWRGLFNVNGHIVTVSVLGFKSRPMSRAQGLSVLKAFATRIQSENPAVYALGAEG